MKSFLTYAFFGLMFGAMVFFATLGVITFSVIQSKTVHCALIKGPTHDHR